MSVLEEDQHAMRIDLRRERWVLILKVGVVLMTMGVESVLKVVGKNGGGRGEGEGGAPRR